jgi:AAA domain, putative AbiEii toxin, Type IV TA system
MNIPGQQPVTGFHMPSHRNLPNYQQIPNIPFGGFVPQAGFGRLIGVAYQAFQGSSSSGSVLFQLKELLAAWAVFGEGNSTLGRDQSQKEAYDGFVDILGRLLPPDLGFTGLKVDAPDIVVLTKSGDFLIDSLSGGLTAIIEVAALIYTRSLMDDVPEGRFVVTMDEPENHLHPAIQRTLLSSLVKAFPNVQFIVATHSPFIVTSSKDARVYALKYEDVVVSEEQWDRSASQHVPTEQLSPHQARRVQCIFLKSGQLSSSTTDILREVLGVPVTFPVWIETSLEAIVGNYRDRPFNERTIADFRQDIDAAGLSEMFPEALLNLGRTN